MQLQQERCILLSYLISGSTSLQKPEGGKQKHIDDQVQSKHKLNFDFLFDVENICEQKFERM